MAIDIKSLSEFKLKLQIAIRNLKKLEEVADQGVEIDEHTSHTATQNTVALIIETDATLKKLENSSTEKFTRLVEKRKKLRKLKRTKNIRKQIAVAEAKWQQDLKLASNIEGAASSSNDKSVTSKSKKPHERLRQYKDAKEFLRFFELIKMLHAARCQGSDEEIGTQQFNSQFEHLESTWRGILHANAPHASNREKQIENEWLEVFFGPKQPTTLTSNRTMDNLIRIRANWDSFIVKDKKNGSCIPTGWVLPPAEPQDEWISYRSDCQRH